MQPTAKGCTLLHAQTVKTRAMYSVIEALMRPPTKSDDGSAQGFAVSLPRHRLFRSQRARQHTCATPLMLVFSVYPLVCVCMCPLGLLFFFGNFIAEKRLTLQCNFRTTNERVTLTYYIRKKMYKTIYRKSEWATLTNETTLFPKRSKIMSYVYWLEFSSAATVAIYICIHITQHEISAPRVKGNWVASAAHCVYPYLVRNATRVSLILKIPRQYICIWERERERDTID